MRGNKNRLIRYASISRRVLVLATIAMLILILLGGWAYLARSDDGGLNGTVWKHQKADGNVTLAFSRLGYIGSPVLRDKTTRGSATGGGEVTYSVLENKTLLLADGHRLAIVSLTSEKLVLSGELVIFGETWKLEKTEFTRD